MKKLIFLSFFHASLLIVGHAQQQVKRSNSPKLVVGMVVDQMRLDYIDRFQSRYGQNGFKRILREGFSCENTFIPYAQTVTAAGHACVYTGSVPAINGIMGNDWYDRSKGRFVYCTEDNDVAVVGAGKGGPMSPKNLKTTTITDELEMATNFRSKVVGVAIKDRGSILPAGHAADAAYWYDGATGNFVSSTWYMKELSPWAKSFNERKMVDSLYRSNWQLTHPFDSYVQSDIHSDRYLKSPFPRKLEDKVGSDYGAIASTPAGNTLTLAFSRSAIEGESLGKDSITDFLAISLSSTDYVGHAFGPNSVEIEDMYLKLDKDLAAFFDYLDRRIGKGQYLFFMTADHAVSHSPGFTMENQLPGKAMKKNDRAEEATIKKFGLKRLVEATANYQVYLDKASIDSVGADFRAVKSFYIEQLNRDEDIFLAFDNEQINSVNLPTEFREMFQKGFNHKLAGDIQVVYNSGNFFTNSLVGATHGTPYAYDAHIPLLWMGWGVKQGVSNRTVYMSDIAPTIAALLKIQMPSGNIGSVIEEVINKQ
ncbi:MAG: alkaline phosphatase PafA [bacterium]